MKRMRWTGRILAALLALTPAVGCKRQLFIEPADYKDAREGPIARLETAPHEAITPPAILPGMVPATVLDPSRPPKYVTLKECVAVALEQGNIGLPPQTNAGLAQDILPQFNGRSTTGTDTIKAFALDPSIVGAEIERSLSKFDARYVASMTWQKVDQAQPAAFQASLQNGDQATLASTLAKPLPTGGVAGISFNTTYRNLSNPPVSGQISALPTSYSPQLQFTFEQPLLQSFGVEVNQLLQQHPGSILIPGLTPSGGVGTEGILVTRIRLDEQRAEFDRQVNGMLYNLEVAYWNLYSAYYNLFAQEEGLKQSYDAYRVITERAVGGLARPQSEFQYRAQVELFRAQVLTARGQVLTSERQLRGLMGMRSDDGTRLVPVDEPTLVPYTPDFYELANEAMAWRPELMIARAELKAQQLNLVLQKNLRRPDVRLLTQYDVNAIGTRLDGVAPQNAFAQLSLNNFNNWQVGLRANIPIGFRDANAQVREAELNLKKSYFYVTDAERKCVEFLVEEYRLTLQAHQLVKYRRAQREALETFVAKNLQVFVTGAVGQNEFEGFIANLVQAQRDLANATGQEFQAIAQYNSALAGLEYAKGTTQRYNNVTIADGPAPKWVEKKAADHFAAREAALKLREHPAEIGAPPLSQWAPLADLPPPPGPQGTPPPLPNQGSGFDKALPLPTFNDGKGQSLPEPKPLPKSGSDSDPTTGNSVPKLPIVPTVPQLQTGPAVAPKTPAVPAAAPQPRAVLTSMPDGVTPVLPPGTVLPPVASDTPAYAPVPSSAPAALPDRTPRATTEPTFKQVGTVTIPRRENRPAGAGIGPPTDTVVPATPTRMTVPPLPIQGVGAIAPMGSGNPSPLLNSPSIR